MIEFGNGGVLVEDVSELPRLPEAVGTLYLDFETGSGDPDKDSLNPWRNCKVIGAGLTWDDCPRAWYILRSVLDQCQYKFLGDAMRRSQVWCNHNVKYDMHVAHNDLGLEFHGDVECTIALARIYDADRTYKGGYRLDKLSKTLLDHDISEHETRMQPFLQTKGKNKNKDYGRVPHRLIGEYGCEDVLTTRKLREFLSENTPTEEAAWVIGNECKLTRALVAMERRGLQINPTNVRIENIRTVKRMLEILDQIESLIGKKLLPTSPKELYELLINEYLFPKIANEKSKGDASFDKWALRTYKELPGYEKHRELIELIAEYRVLDTHKGLYWDAWLELCDERGILHSDTNQNVRSGRTSQKQPNGQQLDKTAKYQIIAREGYTFLCYDHSQLEYRWMVSYLNNERGIAAYLENPHIDYHQWVADTLCEGRVKRKPAKTLNFGIGFGMGKRKLLRSLSLEAEVIRACHGDDMEIRRFTTSVYENYHRNLPELKRHQRYAENTAAKLGYVKTVYGRRLHLPREFAHKGFNRVVQSTAADASKEGIVRSSPVFNERLRELDAHLLAIVHDEFLYEVPDDPEIIQEAHEEIVRCLEAPSARCRVPLIADRGPPAKNWRDAKGD